MRAMDLHEIPEVRQKVGAVTYRELTAGLVWPHMLRALSISLNPKLWFIGFVCSLGLIGGGYALDNIVKQIWDSNVTPFSPLTAFWPTATPLPIDARLSALQSVIDNSPAWWGLPLALWVIPWLALGSIAIGRAAALEFAIAKAPAVRENVRFAVGRWMSALIAFGVPTLILASLYGALWLVGSVLFSADWIATIGGALFGIQLIIAFMIVVLTLLMITGGTMLGAAIGIEDTDGVDAIQRAYAYVVNRPVNLVCYLFVLGLILVIGYVIIEFVFQFAILTAVSSSPIETYARGADSDDTGMLLSGYWITITWLMFMGWILSYVWTAGALLYLGMRRVHDELDMFEVPSAEPRSMRTLSAPTQDDENTSAAVASE